MVIQVSDLRNSGMSLVFCWVPGHSGLPGNGAAHATSMSQMFVSYTALGSDVFTCLHLSDLTLRQGEQDIAEGNKFSVVKPSVQK
jgi:hypothetical protein